MLKLRRLFANLLANIILTEMRVHLPQRPVSKKFKPLTIPSVQPRPAASTNKSKCSEPEEEIHSAAWVAWAAWAAWKMSYRRCLAKVWVVHKEDRQALDPLKKEARMRAHGST
jgi:hypothetical protein